MARRRHEKTAGMPTLHSNPLVTASRSKLDEIDKFVWPKKASKMMMDISVSGGAPGTGCGRRPARSGRPVAGKTTTAADQNGGFVDVSQTGPTVTIRIPIPSIHPTSRTPTRAREAAACNLRGRNRKPLIDLSDASLKGQVDA